MSATRSAEAFARHEAGTTNAHESLRVTPPGFGFGFHGTAALVALTGLMAHAVLKITGAGGVPADAPLLVVLVGAGGPLMFQLARRTIRGEFGADHLAGISIAASLLLHQYLAGAIVVLMLAGGETLEAYAVAEATSVLRALAKRAPVLAHRLAAGAFVDVAVAEVRIGDGLVILPHEVCPVDGDVVEGSGAMDESFLTGEPFHIAKGPGAAVLSGAVNGETSLTIRASRIAADSRYAQIMQVMQDAEQRRPDLRRIGDQLGGWYTPLTLALAGIAWWWAGDAVRFLSVVIVATPCPLLIAIPVAIIGSISTSARRGIIVKDPAALEQITLCRTMILDKTGTLTYGRPVVSAEIYAPPFTRELILPIIGAVERYSRHPLAGALVALAAPFRAEPPRVEWIREDPGRGLAARVAGSDVLITGRKHASERFVLPPAEASGLECCVVIDNRLAATYRFHDQPRDDGRGFIRHLGPNHGFGRLLLVSGDREPEVRRLADAVGIDEIHAAASPEQKVEIVRGETANAKTVFIGDGINDAPALMTATVGIAFGQRSDVTSEAARVVIIDSSLSKVDELIHISRRLRAVALQSAIGGMALSAIGMSLAAFGLLTPVAGAIAQEAIDLVAVLNALRTARAPSAMTDFGSGGN
jgi:heavy metal translocating P-type ATPase